MVRLLALFQEIASASLLPTSASGRVNLRMPERSLKSPRPTFLASFILKFRALICLSKPES
eukprot:3321617-Alexandrium_andersonii.AAC.1